MIDLNRTQLLGHRGARQEAFENSLIGFEYAQRLHASGLSGVELDVQLTADGHLVVFHDETLVRLCGLQSRVDQLSLNELNRHLQSGHQIITLDKLAQALQPVTSQAFTKPVSASYLPTQKQALDRLFNQKNDTDKRRQDDDSLHLQSNARQNDEASSPLVATQTQTTFTHIELEIKTHSRTNYTKLVTALITYLLDSPLSRLPIVLTSFDVQLLAQLQRHKLLSPIARGLLIRAPTLVSQAPNTALQLGCTHLGIHYPLLTQPLIAYCHRHGLFVSAWTVNDIDIAKQLVAWHVDAIITDIPMQLL